MGDKFIGSDDYTLCSAQALTQAIVEGAWTPIQRPAMYELVITVADVSGETMTVKLESDLGVIGGVQKVHEIYSNDYTANQGATADLKFSLGGIPGGRRVRYTGIMGTAETGTLTAVLKETRSGLA